MKYSDKRGKLAPFTGVVSVSPFTKPSAEILPQNLLNCCFWLFREHALTFNHKPELSEPSQAQLEINLFNDDNPFSHQPLGVSFLTSFVPENLI